MAHPKLNKLDTLRNIADKIGLKYYNDHDNQQLLISDGTVDGCRGWDPYNNAHDAVDLMKSLPMIVKAEHGIVMVSSPDASGLESWGSVLLKQHYENEDDRDETIRFLMVRFAARVLQAENGSAVSERGITK
jgi:hypothetical protein